MSAAARTVRIFGIYLALLALTLMLIPNLFLSLFGIAPTAEHWIRVVGMLVFFLAFYYWLASGAENRQFIEWTVWGRLYVVPAFFIVFMALGWIPIVMFGIALVDMAGALWTRSALRKVPAAFAA